MNQILSTSMPMDNKKQKNKNRTSNPASISSILKFFAIAMLIFGVLIIGVGIYAIVQKQNEQKQENLQPTISIENKTDSIVLLKVIYGKNIDRVEYYWNDEDATIVNGNNGRYLEKEIQVPSGKNTLHVLIVDEDGNEIPYEKQYERESNINIDVSGNKIKITYDSENKVSYMTYRWDEEEEKTIQINDTNIEQEIDAIKGLHTLTVVTVDEDNNTDTKVQKINGVSKPKLSVTADETQTYFVIKASDEVKLSKLEFRINQDENQEYVLNLDKFDYNEIQYVVKVKELQSGENIIEVKITNEDGVTEESGVVRITK